MAKKDEHVTAAELKQAREALAQWREEARKRLAVRAAMRQAVEGMAAATAAIVPGRKVGK